MKYCPIDTFKNNKPNSHVTRRQKLFAYSPSYIDNNHIRDFKVVEIRGVLIKVPRAGRIVLGRVKNTTMDLQKMK